MKIKENVTQMVGVVPITQIKLYPVTGEIYTHYKGGTYEIISMAIHTETQEKMVVYKSLSFGSIYTRPYEEFIKPVDKIHNAFGLNNIRFQKLR